MAARPQLVVLHIDLPCTAAGDSAAEGAGKLSLDDNGCKYLAGIKAQCEPTASKIRLQKC